MIFMIKGILHTKKYCIPRSQCGCVLMIFVTQKQVRTARRVAAEALDDDSALLRFEKRTKYTVDISNPLSVPVLYVAAHLNIPVSRKLLRTCYA